MPAQDSARFMTGATRGSKSLKTQVKPGEEAEGRCSLHQREGWANIDAQSKRGGSQTPQGLSPREKQTGCTHLVKNICTSFCEKSQNVIN